MATWTNEGWLWSGDASVFECQGMGRYRLFYSTLLRSYRLRDRDTRLWAPWWFTKEYVKQQRRPNELVVVEAVIRMTKDREREFDANAAVDRMYERSLYHLSNPVWHVTPKREEDREVAKVAETLINSDAWRVQYEAYQRLWQGLYEEESNMEIVDKRPSTRQTSIPFCDIPHGTVFQGRPNGHDKGTFLRTGGTANYAIHIVELSKPFRTWVNTEKNPEWRMLDYQPVHGKITIERNA